MHRVYFPLKYDKGYFSDERWEKVLDLFNQYHQSCSYGLREQYFKMIGEDTLFDYARNIDEIPSAAIYGKVMTKQEIRETFAFVRENNYPLFTDFYECNANKIIGGKI